MRTDAPLEPGLARIDDGSEVAVVVETVHLDASLGTIDIERPADPPALLQEWCNRADPTVIIPYWAEIWPASRAIARRIAAGPDLSGRSILDLGCGLGLAGIAAGRRGGRVTFADHHPDALAFARRNVRRAGIVDASFLLASWGDTAWAHPYDLVLGADVLYERADHEPITELLRVLLGDGGCAWLADPCRDAARPFLEDWIRSGHALRTIEAGPFPGEEVALAIHLLGLSPGSSCE